MAIWRSSLRQTAANDASGIVVAELAAGILTSQEEVDVRFSELVETIFADLDEVAKGDDAAYEDKPAAKGKPEAKGKSNARSSKGRSGGRKGGSSITLEDARDMKLSFGAFEGVSLADLAEIEVEEAESDYQYGDGERDGRDYLSWLAGSSQKNEFVQRRAILVCDDLGIDYE